MKCLLYEAIATKKCGIHSLFSHLPVCYQCFDILVGRQKEHVAHNESPNAGSHIAEISSAKVGANGDFGHLQSYE